MSALGGLLMNHLDGAGAPQFTPLGAQPLREFSSSSACCPALALLARRPLDQTFAGSLDNTPLVWPGLLPVVFHAASADYEQG